MKEYQTKQRQQISDIFKANPKLRYTAYDVQLLLEGSGINKSTVYRNLDRLVGDGVLLRELSEDGSCAVYRYNELSACEGHIHLICSKCKGVIHLEESVGNKMATLLQQSCGFHVVNNDTIIAGLCKNCSK